MSVPLTHTAFAKADAQVCVTCGARYGRCEHTSTMVPARARQEVSAYHSRRWTEGEDDLLIDMHWLDGASTKAIAQRLTRTISSVENRIKRIKRERSVESEA